MPTLLSAGGYRRGDSLNSSEIKQTTTINSTRAIRRKAILAQLLLAILAPVFMLGILEVTAFFWERSQARGVYAWELVASRRIETIPYLQPGTGYTLLEPGRRYQWQSIPVVINSKGLRSPETSYEKPAGVYRILNLGDSIVMGWGVRQEETYGQQLEEILNEKAADGQKVEVINAGVPGWNLANERAFLEAEGMKYQPDLILLDITLVNDIYGKSALVSQNRSGLIEWLRSNTYTWPFLSVQSRWLQARIQGKDRIDVIDPPYKPSSYFPMDTQAQQWKRAVSTIFEIEKLAKENDAQLVLVLFPLEYQVLDSSYSTLPQEIISAKAEKAGIPVLDLLPAYQSACQAIPGGGCSLQDRYLFADVWMHPSSLGHKLTALEIYRFLEGENVSWLQSTETR